MSGHHACVYYAASLAVLPESLQTASADVQHFLEPQWGIAHSRALISAATSRPIAAERKALVVLTEQLTNEAQNALLKLFEDPPATAEFHIVVPSADRLIPTLHSRLQHQTSTTSAADTTDWTELRQQPIAAQLATIAERSKQKDTAWQQTVLTSAVHDIEVPARTRLLLDRYAQAPGASRKLLLEELVLSLAGSAAKRYNA